MNVTKKCTAVLCQAQRKCPDNLSQVVFASHDIAKRLESLSLMTLRAPEGVSPDT